MNAIGENTILSTMRKQKKEETKQIQDQDKKLNDFTAVITTEILVPIPEEEDTDDGTAPSLGEASVLSTLSLPESAISSNASTPDLIAWALCIWLAGYFISIFALVLGISLYVYTRHPEVAARASDCAISTGSFLEAQLKRFSKVIKDRDLKYGFLVLLRKKLSRSADEENTCESRIISNQEREQEEQNKETRSAQLNVEETNTKPQIQETRSTQLNTKETSIESTKGDIDVDATEKAPKNDHNEPITVISEISLEESKSSWTIGREDAETPLLLVGVAAAIGIAALSLMMNGKKR